MKLYKYQGAGNDFLIADNRDGHIFESEGRLYMKRPDGTMWSRSIAGLCDRRYGIGADGLMLLENSDVHDFHMVYYNSDGSGGMMCGNGGRCIVAFAADMGLTHFDFDAADGFHSARITDDAGDVKVVRLKMADVGGVMHYDSLSGVDVPSEGYFLDTGTRHYVRFVDDVDAYDVVGEGRMIRRDASGLQPEGANVNYVEALDDGCLKIRTYEKGVEDETFACGTGIVASCMASYRRGIRPAVSSDGVFRYDVRARRDSLSVEFSVSDAGFEDVWLIGPAAFVAEICRICSDL